MSEVHPKASNKGQLFNILDAVLMTTISSLTNCDRFLMLPGGFGSETVSVLPENSFPTAKQLIQLAGVTEGKVKTFICRNILSFLLWQTVQCCGFRIIYDPCLILLWPIEIHLLFKQPYTLLKLQKSPTGIPHLPSF